MAIPKAERSLQEIEDLMLRRVLQLTLSPPADASNAPSSNLVFLEQIAAELMSEDRPMLLSRDLIERALMDRLTTYFHAREEPLLYLIACYRRAVDEGRKSQAMKDKKSMVWIQETLNQVKELVVSYAGISIIHPGTFPQQELQRNSSKPLSPLLAAMMDESPSSESSGYSGSNLPQGFIEQTIARFQGEELDAIFHGVFIGLRDSVMRLSALGPFQKPLGILVTLVSYPALARALVRHPNFHVRGSNVNGRIFELETILGPFFHIAAVPDLVAFVKGEPDIGRQCFSDASSRRPADILSSCSAIKSCLHHLQDGLHEIVLKLLRSVDTREQVLGFLGDFIEKNAGRAQIQVNPLVNGSTGSFVNLSAVMLKLCDPFLDPPFTKMDKIDLNYVLKNVRVNFSNLTAIHATSEELSRWVDKRNYARIEGFRQAQAQREQEELMRLQSQGASASVVQASVSGQGSFSFICECFFLTARSLNIGPLKAVSDFKTLLQDLSRQKDSLEALKAMQGPGAPADLENTIKNTENNIEQLTQDRYCYEAQFLRDLQLLQECVRFYRLMIVWLVSLVGGFRVPLPAPCPMEFASMPEHFVEDSLEMLLFTARVPKGLEGVSLDEFMSFIVMFMSSPLYVKNPYLRAKMVEVLNAWMPSKNHYAPALSSSLTTLFEGHQLAMDHLVPDLLKLYVDIEFTGSHTQFYDKFNIRHNIAELLEYLWLVPCHHNAWKRIAVTEERGFYLRYLNLLINDSIFLLDESLKKIPELKEMEAERSNVPEWERRPPQERQERLRLFHQIEQHVRSDMILANENVKMLQYTSSEITTPFLLPEMVERIASMLNYFLLQLVITQRKALRIRDPEKYEFRPKELLCQIVEIYANLARGDIHGEFSKAISLDGRSYRDELFKEAIDAIHMINQLPPKTMQDFVLLGEKVKKAVSEAQDTEALLGDVPEEFLDPIQYTLMKDPVILPSSKTTIDRATIQRHLLSDQTDPFNRSLLTADMLVPNVELKARIEEFLRNARKN
ncbi:ubiquitin-protein ligase, UFD2 [Selaginella moellendorffii]|uniref:RING-type E3 ubiquitin transferase n=1 Tax=Selaginella moellendorffii TaxID=88036 RepID=D8T8W5_SELML|nr:probable ubiquitin conjugation factor E4 [Selaginella moellendorffii]EFJ06900.1 ubiquitin-protein ligase, UFD2 [Selaginella moellendorffii]|eukprot:XP_002992051.1 probable ubiquitin conjugation factor E4 [Selaginella moellendorffii]